MFKNEPEVLTVIDVARLLRIGKNSVYELVKTGNIGSIKRGKKIIIPKVCLVEYLLNEKNYQILSPLVPVIHLTCKEKCGSVGVAQNDSKANTKKKGA